MLWPCVCTADLSAHVFLQVAHVRPTLGVSTDCDLSWVFGHILQGGVQLAFPNHEMQDNECLEYDGPC